MRLQTKASLYFHSFALIVFTVGIIAFYFMLRAHFDANIKKDLIGQKDQIIAYAANYDILPSNSFLNIEINKSSCNSISNQIFGDTVIFDISGNEAVYRILDFELEHESECYQIRVLKSLENRNFFLIQMVIGLSALSLVVMAGIFILSRYSLSKTWEVFYDTIRKINSYKINSDLILNETNIKEFKILNNVLSRMTNKIKKDYSNLKEFTENASHEIQTPLAIIRSKLEMVLQTENLTTDQVKDILAAYEATNRLSKMNEALIMLTKIDNKQFKNFEEVNFSTLFIDQLELFEDIIKTKQIISEQFVEENTKICMDKELATILVQNLVKNAIRYVTPGGKIEIKVTSEFISISNTGDPLPFDPGEIFDRFKKSDTHKSSIGLGLSIVKMICDLYKFEIDYSYSQSLHKFLLKNFQSI